MNEFIAFILKSREEIGEQLLEHLQLTFISLGLAICISIPLGVWLVRQERFSGFVLGVVSAIQTIPSLALLGLMLPLLGIGVVPAVTALFLYALLPLVRNIYTGIKEIDPTVILAARGMGLSKGQILRKIELPIALPIIFAGIRTAAVINVGVATLASLIGAGGLGEYIFRGISLNNTHMLLAGAVPAALLALLIDFLLGILERLIRRRPRLTLLLIGGMILAILLAAGVRFLLKPDEVGVTLRGGFVDEFMNRDDGLIGLNKTYGMAIDGQQFESGLMFQALINGDVDLISGYSTDGRIAASNLKILEDDLHFFPPYHCAAFVRMQTLEKYPELRTALIQLENLLPDTTMARLNYLADFEQQLPERVARDFLNAKGFETAKDRTGPADIRIGSKSFTEQFILAHMLTILIENTTSLTVEPVIGMAGTKICFDALRTGEIDLYPEYTGTALLAILSTAPATVERLGSDREVIFEYVQQQTQELYQLEWVAPFGFNNTWAMMMRQDQAAQLGIERVSDLRPYVNLPE